MEESIAGIFSNTFLRNCYRVIGCSLLHKHPISSWIVLIIRKFFFVEPTSVIFNFHLLFLAHGASYNVEFSSAWQPFKYSIQRQISHFPCFSISRLNLLEYLYLIYVISLYLFEVTVDCLTKHLLSTPFFLTCLQSKVWKSAKGNDETQFWPMQCKNLARNFLRKHFVS